MAVYWVHCREHAETTNQIKAIVIPMTGFLTLFSSRWYWLVLALGGIGLLMVALYYQYALGEEPCQVCIHARIWVMAFTLIALVMCVAPASKLLYSVANLLVITCAAGLAERSWYLYQIENGRGDGSCEFQLGMPDWFALDRWFPDLFEVRNLCTYTPEVLFGLSMAESLLLAAAGVAAYAIVSLVSISRSTATG